MLKICENWFKGNKGYDCVLVLISLVIQPTFFTCRLTNLAPFARAQFLVSFFFFFFFLTICFFFHILDRISTKPGQNDQWVSGYKSYALFDLKGHVRVTGVKKGHFYGKMHLLLHALLDFDETWSEASVGKWLQKLCFIWPQRSCRGHRGQKSNLFFKMLRLSWNFNTMILMTF